MLMAGIRPGAGCIWTTATASTGSWRILDGRDEPALRPGGTTIGPAQGGNTETTVSVPAGDCQGQTQVTITEPDIAAIGNAGICGYQAVAGVGIIMQNGDGSVDNAFLLHPIVVTISSPAIKPGDIVVAWNGREFERVGVAEHGGSVTVKLTRAGENFFAILQPTSTEFDPCDSRGLGGGGLGGDGLGGGGGAGGANGFGFGAFGPGSFGQPGVGQAFLAALLQALTGHMPSGMGVLAGPPHTCSPASLAQSPRARDAECEAPHGRGPRRSRWPPSPRPVAAGVVRRRARGRLVMRQPRRIAGFRSASCTRRVA